MNEKQKNFNEIPKIEEKTLLRRGVLGGWAITDVLGIKRVGKKHEQLGVEIDDELEAKFEAVRALGQKLYDYLTDTVAYGEQDDVRSQPTTRTEQEKFRSIFLDIHDTAAQTIIDRLHAIDAALEIDRENAPFAQKQNKVKKREIEEYLDKKSYTDTSELKGKGFRSVRIESHDDIIPVPISLITSAVGFDSWQGREGEYKKYIKNGQETVGTSLDAMAHYASLPTPIPPVLQLRIYVQPDGQVFGDNGKGDSHRIAAAYLRGDKTVGTYELHVTSLNENVISGP